MKRGAKRKRRFANYLPRFPFPFRSKSCERSPNKQHSPLPQAEAKEAKTQTKRHQKTQKKKIIINYAENIHFYAISNELCARFGPSSSVRPFANRSRCSPWPRSQVADRKFNVTHVAAIEARAGICVGRLCVCLSASVSSKSFVSSSINFGGEEIVYNLIAVISK